MPLVSKNIIVRPFEPSEWKQYRETRLTALKDSPDAFGSVLETSSLIPDSGWVDRLANISPERDLPLVGLVDSEIGGMAWANIDNPENRIAHLYQMWVAPQFRGFRLGQGLLNAAMAWAAAQGVSCMRLSVTCGDTPARKLYESAGFIPVGNPEPLRPGSDLEVQPMEYTLSG